MSKARENATARSGDGARELARVAQDELGDLAAVLEVDLRELETVLALALPSVRATDDAGRGGSILNIVATYEGYRQGRVSESDAAASSGKDLKTVVTLNIGGTRYEPQLKMSMKVQLTPGGDLTDWSSTAGGGDVQSDAISFILTGKFREDLTSGERAGIAADVGASTTTSVVSGFTSNLLSGILDNYVRKEFPFIRSVDVSYQDGQPIVNIGASPGLGYLRVGKRFNNINNTNVSYQVSMGDIFNSTTIRNLFLEIQRRVENDLTGANREDITNEARLYYRFSF